MREVTEKNEAHETGIVDETPMMKMMTSLSLFLPTLPL
jgi:hypothetical protein